MQPSNIEKISVQESKLVDGTIVIDAKQIDNVVLRRLIEEIDFEKKNNMHSYNRTHNRHNRGR